MPARASVLVARKAAPRSSRLITLIISVRSVVRGGIVGIVLRMVWKVLVKVSRVSWFYYGCVDEICLTIIAFVGE